MFFFSKLTFFLQAAEQKEAETPSQPLDLGFPDEDDDGNSPEGCKSYLDIVHIW